MMERKESKHSLYLAHLVLFREREEQFYKQHMLTNRRMELSDLQESYAKKKGRRKEDVFGDNSKMKGFMAKSQTFDYENFNQQDWNNFVYIVERLDSHVSFQRKIAEIARKHLGEKSDVFIRIMQDLKQRRK